MKKIQIYKMSGSGDWRAQSTETNTQERENSSLDIAVFAAALIQPKLFFKLALTQESESSPLDIIILLVLL